LREHVQLGHAVTVHAAQGVTAESTHAVLADTASRNLVYVALTRGREANHAYLYQRDTPEADYTHSHDLDAATEAVHLARRGSPTQAARVLRHVIGRHEPTRTAYQVAADTPTHLLPEVVADLVAEHHRAVTRRRSTYQKVQRAHRDRTLDRHLSLDRSRSQGREQDSGYDLSL
jgi:hypothetical protein